VFSVCGSFAAARLIFAFGSALFYVFAGSLPLPLFICLPRR
jgi:hypothetical protein